MRNNATGLQCSDLNGQGLHFCGEITYSASTEINLKQNIAGVRIGAAP